MPRHLDGLHPTTLLLLVCVVNLSRPVCVDIPSETKAVLGKMMKLTCISCMKREEVKAKTHVDWYYKPLGANNSKTLIYKYKINATEEVDGPFKGRLTWNGSQDLQDISISIVNVTMNDSGVYECHVLRKFEFDSYSPSALVEKNITLQVILEASTDTAALYSEVMMYLLLVFLTIWLLVEMVYCYRKISMADELAQDTAADYLAVPSEQKDNPVSE
ncbi:sodium channel regulatory subunit beta-3 isoform X1 [Nerophis lumbriciformis]|uniref:sodium channel regulatory subunit beta-3 isoform X1 n=2 Tax=Nerophis lumbriciformis TaxID=546530 RepID=UPI002AE08FFF|nr:sodium channel subunit beta-3 isoform X1 [Nerophis lumbriciformis]XP_061828970.1 sodium channel subunit beta-3 isoform X1 [Nerophis lumbriciformis]XP_061828971.1 sodium channel subunit beta-3 isoform X1 [Nerophis lumbriciformis]